MATIIRTEDGKLHELSLRTEDGVDYLADVMGNSGVAMSEDDRAEFDLTTEDYEWWKVWAANEQLINDTIAERNLTHAIPNFYDEHPDWDDAQAAYAKFLGIEISPF